MTKQLTILGSPIGPALSPVLHRAACQALGLDWIYRAIDCTPERLPAFLAGLDEAWAGPVADLDSVGDLEVSRYSSVVNGHARVVPPTDAAVEVSVVPSPPFR